MPRKKSHDMAYFSPGLLKITISVLAAFGMTAGYAAWELFSDPRPSAYHSSIFYKENLPENTGYYNINHDFPLNSDTLKQFISTTHSEKEQARIPAQTPSRLITELRRKNPFLDDFIAAADAYNVPLLLLLAICEQESGTKPWALNISGKSFLPDSRESALSLLQANFQPSYDVGLMQINSYWIRRLKLRVQDAFEPKINIHIAAYILDECFRTYGMNWKALGAYHHPPDRNSARSMRYARSVWGKYLRQKNRAEEFFQK